MVLANFNSSGFTWHNLSPTFYLCPLFFSSPVLPPFPPFPPPPPLSYLSAVSEWKISYLDLQLEQRNTAEWTKGFLLYCIMHWHTGSSSVLAELGTWNVKHLHTTFNWSQVEYPAVRENWVFTQELEKVKELMRTPERLAPEKEPGRTPGAFLCVRKDWPRHFKPNCAARMEKFKLAHLPMDNKFNSKRGR